MGLQNFEQGLDEIDGFNGIDGSEEFDWWVWRNLIWLMGLMKLIDGSDEILADPDLKKTDPTLLWYTIAHPSLAWEEEIFC
jgi:hypothetical protein